MDFAGGAVIKNPVFLVGGPMMGNIREAAFPVTKTTNAVLVLSEEHPLIQKKN